MNLVLIKTILQSDNEAPSAIINNFINDIDNDNDNDKNMHNLTTITVTNAQIFALTSIFKSFC